MKYNPCDMVIIKECSDYTASSKSWTWKDKSGIVINCLDPLVMAIADAGTGGYDYQIFLAGELVYFHEDELIRVG